MYVLYQSRHLRIVKCTETLSETQSTEWDASHKALVQFICYCNST